MLAVTVAVLIRVPVRTAQGASMPRPNFTEEAESGFLLPASPGSRERPQMAGHCSCISAALVPNPKMSAQAQGWAGEAWCPFILRVSTSPLPKSVLSWVFFLSRPRMSLPRPGVCFRPQTPPPTLSLLLNTTRTQLVTFKVLSPPTATGGWPRGPGAEHRAAPTGSHPPGGVSYVVETCQ